METTPTFWRLDGRIGWRTDRRAGVTVGERTGIRLAAEPSGPLAPGAPWGTLGGLRLPRGMALDAHGTVHLLAGDRLLRFDPARCAFVPVTLARPAAVEADPPTHLAFAGGGLYLAGAHALLVYDARTLALVEWHGADDWDVVGIDARDDRVWVADAGSRRIHRHSWARDGLVLLVDGPDDGGRWEALAVDREGRAHVYDAQAGRLLVFAADGRPEVVPDDPGDVRDRFDPPPILLDHCGRFCLPAGLMEPCGRRPPDAGPPPHAPLALCAAGSSGRVFGRDGCPSAWDPSEGAGRPPYVRSGMWVSELLDSRIANCQWDRVEFDVDVPPGARVVASTYTEEEQGRPVERIADDLWSPRTPLSPEGDDLLVQSRGGRYLRLRLQLTGDGYATPAVRCIRARFPRDSYLRLLPAIFSADDDSRWFLERFLSVFQAEWDPLEEELGRVEHFFDPAAVPEGAALNFLAGWLALPLEAAWDGEQQRRLLTVAPKLAARRGTAFAVREHLRAYLESMTRTRLPDDGFPQILEGFTERDLAVLGGDAGTRLGHGPPIWSASVVGRLQLGRFAREGEARMVSTGAPPRDAFDQHAHRFRVFVPAAWVRTAEDERMVRRALDTEKPAHTAYDLCLVEPRFRIGVQSTVGLDTIIAELPQATLGGCCHDEAAPSLPPSRRLGFDTVLHCRDACAGAYGSPRRLGEEALT